MRSRPSLSSSRPSAPLAALLLSLLVIPLAACASGQPGAATANRARKPNDPKGPRDLPVITVPDLDDRALLLLLVDRQIYEPVAVEHALKGGPELREELAASLGRIPDSQGRTVLEGLLLDQEPKVRRAAAFALGELEDRAAIPNLERAEVDADRETGVLAVEALGKLGAPVVEVGEHLVSLPEEERWARLVPHLYRFKGEEKLPLVEHALALVDPELHARAAFALCREPVAAGLPLIRPLATDPSPLVRSWAARALGLVGAAEDLPRLLPLLDDPEIGPVVQALKAGQKLLQDGKAKPPLPEPDWRPRIVQLIADPRPGVAVTALEAAGAWPLDDGPAGLAAALVARAEKGKGRERGVALVALASAGHPRALELATTAAHAVDPDVRARAAQAAGILTGEPKAAPLLAQLSADPSAEVREAALDARIAALGEKGAPEAARTGLLDPDEGVRATALEWLTTHPKLPLESLGPALQKSLADRTIESPLTAIQAIVARAKTEPLERGAIVGLLEKLAVERRWLLRREAVAGLVALDRPPLPLGSADATDPVEAYRELVQRSRRTRRGQLDTAKGKIVLALDCPQAPLTCLSFLQLAGQGFFDGLTFHRVVPDFVVQGGDPRGDGFGGPGYTIRDEINRIRYERGTVGMALAGPDTGGSQFFIALSPQPHLDGGYTAFGKVVEGMNLLDQIQADDRIEKVTELP